MFTHRVQSLGVMRYVPVATAAYVERYLTDGFTTQAVTTAPSLAWNRNDALRDMLVRKAFRRIVARPVVRSAAASLRRRRGE